MVFDPAIPRELAFNQAFWLVEYRASKQIYDRGEELDLVSELPKSTGIMLPTGAMTLDLASSVSWEGNGPYIWNASLTPTYILWHKSFGSRERNICSGLMSLPAARGSSDTYGATCSYLTFENDTSKRFSTKSISIRYIPSRTTETAYEL